MTLVRQLLQAITRRSEEAGERVAPRQRRIAVLLRSSVHAATTPSMYHAVRLLAQQGYAVDLVTVADPKYRYPVFDLDGIRLLTVVGAVGKGFLPGMTLLRYLLFTLRTCLPLTYSCFIGADPDGLAAATVLSLIKGVPAVYYSLEIQTLDANSTRGQRLRKAVERWCHRRADFTIVQDRARANLLLKENHLPSAEVVLVPNAPSGRPSVATKGDHWHRKYNLPRDRVIMLHAGGIADYNCALELAQVAHAWPDEWVLVVHGFGEDSYIDRVRQFVDGKHVILSLDTVSYEELDHLIASADVGIALYSSEHGANVRSVGKSSGKIMEYLRHGLPVVSSDLPGLRELLVDHGCGLVTSAAGEVGSAIRHILDDYDNYHRHAIHCFETEGDFERHFIPVLDRIGRA